MPGQGVPELDTGAALEDGEAAADDLDGTDLPEAELGINTKIHNGWRCSYVRAEHALSLVAGQKRRRYMVKQARSIADAARVQPVASRHRPAEEKIRRAKTAAAKRKLRCAA